MNYIKRRIGFAILWFFVVLIIGWYNLLRVPGSDVGVLTLYATIFGAGAALFWTALGIPTRGARKQKSESKVAKDIRDAMGMTLEEMEEVERKSQAPVKEDGKESSPAPQSLRIGRHKIAVHKVELVEADVILQDAKLLGTETTGYDVQDDER